MLILIPDYDSPLQQTILTLHLLPEGRTFSVPFCTEPYLFVLSRIFSCWAVPFQQTYLFVHQTYLSSDVRVHQTYLFVLPYLFSRRTFSYWAVPYQQTQSPFVVAATVAVASVVPWCICRAANRPSRYKPHLCRTPRPPLRRKARTGASPRHSASASCCGPAGGRGRGGTARLQPQSLHSRGCGPAANEKLSKLL